MKTNQIRTRALRCIALGLFTLSLSPVARGAATALPPDRMTYQGYLVDGNGNTLGATNAKNYDVIFRIYADQSAGTALWAEQQTVTVDNGQFSLMLGEGNQFAGEPRPVLGSLFASTTASDRYVEMTVKGVGPSGADATMMPRVRLLPAPYAFLSRHANTADTLVNNSNTPVLSVANTYVGINKASPTSALDVAGTVTTTGLQVNGNTTVTGTVAAVSFVGNGTIPVGGIIMWSGASVPTGWALCDGTTNSGKTTPDLRGRFVLGSGQGTGLSLRSLSQIGGTESNTLATAQMPVHSHTVDPPGTSISGGNHSHLVYGDYGGGITGASGATGDVALHNSDGASGYSKNTSSETHSHTVDIASFNSGSTGSGQAVNNVPPYYVLAFIMRVQ